MANYNNFNNNFVPNRGGFDYGRITNMFPEFDKNGDGRITLEDFVIAARRRNLGPQGEMAYRNAFYQIDQNRNGYLDLEETARAYTLIEDLLIR